MQTYIIQLSGKHTAFEKGIDMIYMQFSYQLSISNERVRDFPPGMWLILDIHRDNRLNKFVFYSNRYFINGNFSFNTIG